MYDVSTQGVDEHMINVHYYYSGCFQQMFCLAFLFVFVRPTDSSIVSCVIYFFLQLEAEKSSLSGEKAALEQEKAGIRDDLVRAEQEKMDLDTEKHGECVVMQTYTVPVTCLKQKVITVKRYALLYSDADLYGTCVRSEPECY